MTAHPYAMEVRGRALRAQVQLGETTAVRAALAEMSEDSRDRAEIRIAAAALEFAEDRPEQALDELAPCSRARRRHSVQPAAAIEALLYAAAAHWELGDVRAAEASLERALAWPSRRACCFRSRSSRCASSSSATVAIAPPTPRCSRRSSTCWRAPRPRPEAAPLLESLSDAELRVVRYLPGNLKGPEIAAELCVSPNTIRTHLRHIYAKLDAHSRTQAVARARQLGLLAPA